MPELIPSREYVVEPVDWTSVSPAFRDFFERYFVSSYGLSRGEADLTCLSRLSVDEVDRARALLRKNLHLRYAHIIDGLGLSRDKAAVLELRAMLDQEIDLSRKLTLGRNLWLIDRDPVFVELLEQMTRSSESTLKEAHIRDVLILRDERTIELLVRLLDDSGSFVRALALQLLNGIEFQTNFVMPSDRLPHDASYYGMHGADADFVSRMVVHLTAEPRQWPVVTKWSRPTRR